VREEKGEHDVRIRIRNDSDARVTSPWLRALPHQLEVGVFGDCTVCAIRADVAASAVTRDTCAGSRLLQICICSPDLLHCLASPLCAAGATVAASLSEPDSESAGSADVAAFRQGIRREESEGEGGSGS
jgi:hypothetical protein